MKKKESLLKKTIRKKNEKDEMKTWGPRTVVCKSMEEFDEIFYKKYDAQMVSPGKAAAELGVSRAYVHQLEKEGKIEVYRIPFECMEWDKLPLHWKVISPVKETYIYIAIEEIEKVKKEMIKKAEDKLKKLKGKK